MKYISAILNFLTFFGLISNQLSGYCESDQSFNFTDFKSPEDGYNDTNDTEPIELDGTSLYNKNNISLNKVKFLMEVGKLKQIERTGWVLNKIHSPERIAGHMWRMAVIPLLVLNPNNSNIDLNKVVKLALIHDIAECIVGDFTPYDDITFEQKRKLEDNAIQYLSSLLPSRISENFAELYREYEEQLTLEAQLTKELDRFDLVLQAFEYERSEYKRKGKLPSLSEFFDFERILSNIRNRELKEMLAEILHQRSVFLINSCLEKCDLENVKSKKLKKNKRVKTEKI